MKRTVVFLLSFLVLGVVAICGTGNNAFAGKYTPPSPEAAVLICQVTSTGTTFAVTAVSTTVAITGITDCAAALVAFANAGLEIRDIKVLNTTPISVLYTLVNGPP